MAAAQECTGSSAVDDCVAPLATLMAPTVDEPPAQHPRRRRPLSDMQASTRSSPRLASKSKIRSSSKQDRIKEGKAKGTVERWVQAADIPVCTSCSLSHRARLWRAPGPTSPVWRYCGLGEAWHTVGAAGPSEARCEKARDQSAARRVRPIGVSPKGDDIVKGTR